MHSYYHLVPLVCCYCSVGYLSDSVDYSSYRIYIFPREERFFCMSKTNTGSKSNEYY
jgi:hypothetical protein